MNFFTELAAGNKMAKMLLFVLEKLSSHFEIILVVLHGKQKVLICDLKIDRMVLSIRFLQNYCFEISPVDMCVVDFLCVCFLLLFFVCFIFFFFLFFFFFFVYLFSKFRK